MNVLLLGPARESIVSFLKKLGNEVKVIESPITLNDCKGFDFIISYGYRHIVGVDIVKAFKNRAINMHIAYLPWNRGADPNLWSFIDNTQKGVTIHWLEKGLDTGDILVQKEVKFGQDDTLKTSYGKLSVAMEQLFFKSFEAIAKGKIKGKPQSGKGSYHKVVDKEPFHYLLDIKKFDTKVVDIMKWKKGISVSNHIESVLKELNCPGDMKKDMLKLSTFTVFEKNVKKRIARGFTEREAIKKVARTYLNELWKFEV